MQYSQSRVIHITSLRFFRSSTARPVSFFFNCYLPLGGLGPRGATRPRKNRRCCLPILTGGVAWDPVGDSRRTRRATGRREAHYGGGRAWNAASRGVSRGPRGGDLGRGVERVEPGRVVEVERPVVAQRGEVVRGVGDGEEQRALRR